MAVARHDPRLDVRNDLRHEQVLDISTLGAPPHLAVVRRIARERARDGYRCHPASWPFSQMCVQITIDGHGLAWPDGMHAAPRELPVGSALVYDSRIHPRLAYGRDGTAEWEFLYLTLRGEIATLAARDLGRLHRHAVPLGADHPLLAELQGELRGASAHAVWTLARSTSLAMRVLAALGGAGDHALRAPADRVVAQAMALMSSDLSLAAVARRCGLSREHLTRLFTTRTGTSPGRWRRRARMREAARRILGGEPIARVARACGHADAAHFAQSFRAHTGLAPSAFRRAGGVPGWA